MLSYEPELFYCLLNWLGVSFRSWLDPDPISFLEDVLKSLLG